VDSSSARALLVDHLSRKPFFCSLFLSLSLSFTRVGEECDQSARSFVRAFCAFACAAGISRNKKKSKIPKQTTKGVCVCAEKKKRDEGGD